MKKIILTFLTLMVTATMSAQYITTPSDIWPGKKMPDGTAKNPVKWDERPDEGNRFTEVSNPTLECFTPIAGTDNGQAVIVCPGGAYSILAYTKEGQEIAQWLARQGYTAYVLAYRIPNNRQGALADAHRAIRLARSKGHSKVGIIGFSAGASLSCRAATRWAEATYKPVDDVDALSCRPDFGILIYPAYLDEGPDHTLTPELTVNAQTPPLFVFGTLDDTKYSGPSCPVLLSAMQKAGAPIELHYLPKGGHGYGMRRGAGFIWPGLCETWLKQLK